ncbi:MAG: hypothetical protein OIF54_02955 [Cohaesibacter sp.]|nr:hypothetical protein [Cohaesibacter sp.]
MLESTDFQDLGTLLHFLQRIIEFLAEDSNGSAFYGLLAPHNAIHFNSRTDQIRT